jgi:hypothetical protein
MASDWTQEHAPCAIIKIIYALRIHEVQMGIIFFNALLIRILIAFYNRLLIRTLKKVWRIVAYQRKSSSMNALHIFSAL